MKLPRRRRMEGKTDYKARLALLKSEKPRLVVRKTNRYIIAQIVSSDIAQDKVILTVNSKSLISKGWPETKKNSLKNRYASYLTGWLIGSEAKNKGISEVILDTGMYRNIHKSRIYSVLRGALDAGLNIPHSEESLPSLEKSEDKEMISILNKIKGKA